MPIGPIGRISPIPISRTRFDSRGNVATSSEWPHLSKAQSTLVDRLIFVKPLNPLGASWCLYYNAPE